MLIDGYLDTATDERLVLSSDADLDRVDALRADSDAILVGAATLRNDNPRLLVRAPSRRAERTARGLPSTPIKVTVTSRAELDPCADFFVTGDTEKLVYCPTDAVAEARCRLGAGSGRSPRSSTVVGRSKCAGSARTCAPAASGG
jgi:5-amino-6-(5-phosphoribosylamino)uracil reductase